MHLKTEALKNKIKGVKDKVIDKTSDALSFPKRAVNKIKESYANVDTDIIKGTREFNQKKVPSFDYKGNPTTAGEYRVARDFVERKYNKKK